jgi:hypothetical protein
MATPTFVSLTSTVSPVSDEKCKRKESNLWIQLKDSPGNQERLRRTTAVHRNDKWHRWQKLPERLWLSSPSVFWTTIFLQNPSPSEQRTNVMPKIHRVQGWDYMCVCSSDKKCNQRSPQEESTSLSNGSLKRSQRIKRIKYFCKLVLTDPSTYTFMHSLLCQNISHKQNYQKLMCLVRCRA